MTDRQKALLLIGGGIAAIVLAIVLSFSIGGPGANAETKKAPDSVETEEQKVAKKKAADEAELAKEKKLRVLKHLTWEETTLREELGFSPWPKDDFDKFDIEAKALELRRKIGVLAGQVSTKRDELAKLANQYDLLWSQKRARFLATFPKVIKKEERVTKKAGFGKLNLKEKIAELEKEIESLRDEALVAQLEAAKTAKEKAEEDAQTAKDKAIETLAKAKKDAEDARRLMELEAKKLPEYGPQEIGQMRKMYGGYKMYYLALKGKEIDLDSKIAQIEKRHEGEVERAAKRQEKLQKDRQIAREKGDEKESARLQRELKHLETDFVIYTQAKDRAVALENRRKEINAIEIQRAEKHAKFLKAELGK